MSNQILQNINNQPESENHLYEESELQKLDLKLKMKSVLRIKSEQTSEEMKELKELNVDYIYPRYLNFASIMGNNTSLKYVNL